MSSKYAQSGNWSQRNQRRPGGQIFRDQHGRKYHAEIELKTGHPCGPMMAQFSAPLAVPQQYLELSNDPEQLSRVTVAYTRWKQDTRTARKDWDTEGRQRSMKMYGDQYDPRKAFGAEILDIIGPPPSAIEPIIAAEQGNSWVLGLSDRVDLRLAKYFEPEQLDPHYREAEPDFRDESFEALEDNASKALEESRKKEREKKQRQRDRKKQHAEGLSETDDAA